jgi:NAD(P)-dependent dehydrogenase (short-subunit alcohol dehydrogenase family)
VFGVNVTAVFQQTRELLPLLHPQPPVTPIRQVINLGSVMGTQPLADDAYSYRLEGRRSPPDAHAGVEFAARRITVNAFAPGPFQSRMMLSQPGRRSRRNMSAIMFR